MHPEQFTLFLPLFFVLIFVAVVKKFVRSESVRFGLMAAFMLSAGPALKAQTFPYVVHDLGTLSGGQAGASAGFALNNSGQVTGVSSTADGTGEHVFVSGPGGALPLRDLDTFGGPISAGCAINDSGQVTGYASPANALCAFLSAPNGGPLRDLGAFGGTIAQGNGVNASGQVTGRASTTGNGTQLAFLSGPNGGALINLGTLGGDSSVGYGVNAIGQVTGYSFTTGNVAQHAFLSAPNGGPLIDLGTLGGTASGGSGLNDSGQVVGFSFIAGDTAQHAFLSAPNGGPLTDLGAMGGKSSGANKINNSGQVVGSLETAAGLYRAFLYTARDGMRDLNDLIDPATGFTMTAGGDINEFGQITGMGKNSTGRVHAFLLTPSYLESFNRGIKEFTLVGNTFTAKIQAFTGHTYQLQRTASLDPATVNWQDVGPSFVPASDQVLSLKDTNATGTVMFYRVKLTP